MSTRRFSPLSCPCDDPATRQRKGASHATTHLNRIAILPPCALQYVRRGTYSVRRCRAHSHLRPTAQPLARTIPVVAGDGLHLDQDLVALLHAQPVGERQGPVRVVEAERHGGVDVLCRG